MTVTIDNAPIRELIDAEKLQARIAEMGAELTDAYRGLDPVLVCILKGSMPFFAALGQAMTIPVRYDYLAVASYHGGTKSSGVVKFLADLSTDIVGRHVVLVEDIVDTGRTMAYLLENLKTRQPASLEVVTLLDKPSRREVDVPIGYRGFEIPDEFVIGFGLDYAQYYRNLPYIGVLEQIPEVPKPGA